MSYDSTVFSSDRSQGSSTCTYWRWHWVASPGLESVASESLLKHLVGLASRWGSRIIPNHWHSPVSPGDVGLCNPGFRSCTLSSPRPYPHNNITVFYFPPGLKKVAFTQSKKTSVGLWKWCHAFAKPQCRIFTRHCNSHHTWNIRIGPVLLIITSHFTRMSTRNTATENTLVYFISSIPLETSLWKRISLTIVKKNHSNTTVR